MAVVNIRHRLKSALSEAIKRRDETAVTALRVAIAAIDNAEAVQAPPSKGSGRHFAGAALGAGAREAARRELTEEEVARIVATEAAELRSAAEDYARRGRDSEAERLRAQASVLDEELRTLPLQIIERDPSQG